MKRCSMCFLEKQRLDQIAPQTELVCRGCVLSVEKVIGWFEHEGYGFIRLLPPPTEAELTDAIADPPLPPTKAVAPTEDPKVKPR